MHTVSCWSSRASRFLRKLPIYNRFTHHSKKSSPNRIKELALGTPAVGKEPYLRSWHMRRYLPNVFEILFAAIMVIFSVLAIEHYKAQLHPDQPAGPPAIRFLLRQPSPATPDTITFRADHASAISTPEDLCIAASCSSSALVRCLRG